MRPTGESNLALFIDFDNVAIGARDSRQRFDVRLLLQRVLEKGKVVVKRAYADWHYYKEHMTPLHEAAIDLIEVPSPKLSGKNSADIRLVVDAIDLCYAKGHIDTFVIVSGDSDFSPLVSKLRENDKRVIGIGVRSSSSHLLISNCDEFIFYDDIYNSAVTKLSEKVSSVPQDLRQLFDFLLQTTQSLLQESRGVLYSSLIKDTMKRKQPEFNESNYGYTTFGDLLEDARDRGLLEVERDSRAGGTLVVLGLGKGELGPDGRRAKTRRRRRDRPRKDDDGLDRTEASAEVKAQTENEDSGPSQDQPAAAGPDPGDPASESQAETPRSSRRGGRRRGRKKSRTTREGDEAAATGESSAEPAAEPSGDRDESASDPTPPAGAPDRSESDADGAAARKTAAKAPSKTAKKSAGTKAKKATKKAAKKTTEKSARATTKKAAGTGSRKTTKKAATENPAGADDAVAEGTSRSSKSTGSSRRARATTRKTGKKTSSGSDPSSD